MKAVILVEGLSDQAALLALAHRQDRSLDAEGIAVIAMGGASNIGRYLAEFGPAGRDLRLAGLYDAAEVGYFRRALERTGLLPRFAESRSELERSEPSRIAMEALGFCACVSDLEDELIRALGVPEVLRILADERELGAFHTLQQQPAHQNHSTEEQLHRFLGTRSGRKIRYGRLLVEALDPSRIPHPLTRVMAV
jgi:hypothetical protein